MNSVKWSFFFLFLFFLFFVIAQLLWLSSRLCSATNLLCDFGQLPFPLWSSKLVFR